MLHMLTHTFTYPAFTLLLSHATSTQLLNSLNSSSAAVKWKSQLMTLEVNRSEVQARHFWVL